MYSRTCLIRHSFEFAICRIRKFKMYSKTLICVQKLCRIDIIPDYTGVGLGRFHCICIGGGFSVRLISAVVSALWGDPAFSGSTSLYH